MNYEVMNYFDPPITDENVLHKHYMNSKLVLIIHDILKTKETWRVTFQDLLDIMKYGFEKEEIRSYTIRIKFKKEDKKSLPMQLRHLLSNLILWKPFIDIDRVELLDASYIFDFSRFETKTLMEYINEKILTVHDGDFASKNAMVNDICHSIINISHAFCLLMGMGVSIYDIHQIELRNPEAAEIMHSNIDANLEPDEIERELARRTDRLIELISQDSGNNDMKPLFVSGSGIKPAQFREFVVKIGFKSDLSGNTIPILINSSFLMDGLRKPSEYYINALSGRKAALNSKIAISKPGAFAKKLSQAATSSGLLRDDHEMCDSIGYILYEIKDKTFLKMLNGRYYYDEQGTMHCLNYQTDTHLIGKIVPFRSPITCASEDGVCKYCYGKLFDINNSMFSPGVLASLKLTEKLSQGVLSAKHSQSTHSNAITFDEDFYKLFETISTEITLRNDSDIDDVLFLKLDNVMVEELDDSEFYFVNSFDIIDGDKKIAYHIEETNGSKMYLNQMLITKYKGRNKAKTNNSVLIALDDIDDEESLFTIEVKSEELTDPIKLFEGLLNRKDHMGARTINDLAQKFAEALISLGTVYDLTHAEMVLRAIIRKKSNILEYPDFSRGGNPHDWQILRLNDALLYHPSAMVSMPYGYLKKQLISSELYEKSAPSHLDALFVSNLSKYIN